jgi:hypothetical protein
MEYSLTGAQKCCQADQYKEWKIMRGTVGSVGRAHDCYALYNLLTFPSFCNHIILKKKKKNNKRKTIISV